MPDGGAWRDMGNRDGTNPEIPEIPEIPDNLVWQGAIDSTVRDMGSRDDGDNEPVVSPTRTGSQASLSDSLNRLVAIAQQGQQGSEAANADTKLLSEDVPALLSLIHGELRTISELLKEMSN